MIKKIIRNYQICYGVEVGIKMKQGTTSIQNIDFKTIEKFRTAKLDHQAKIGKEITNDEFLQELLK